MVKLDLENVRIYAKTKNDIIDALDLLGEEVYFSDCVKFRTHIKDKLTGVIYATDDNCPYFRRGKNLDQWGYKYIILEKDAKFKDIEDIEEDKELYIVKETNWNSCNFVV